MMIYENLYEKVLIEPCKEGADTLKIISGFATSTMASEHLEDLHQKHLTAQIILTVGMCPAAGLSVSNHKGFQNIVNSNAEAFRKHFVCSYIYKAPSVHTKLYVWYKKQSLYRAFVGSANYTHNAFYNQREILAEIASQNIEHYCQTLDAVSILCNHPDAETLVRFYNDSGYYKDKLLRPGPTKYLPNINYVVVSLLSHRTGEVQNKGGLNWGQRPGRNKNQAYLQLPADVYKSDFFPKAPQTFTVITDDSKTFICRRAEKDQQGQAIHTPLNNSSLGEYFRNRLGLPNGSVVTRQDLEKYGRTDVVFYKFDTGDYYMDFSSHPS
ncbi:MAG: NgoFVII family restriction endonuclease [Elusimicrobiota bacterium]|jgi:hypothetical protein|nr:NgoFVII family restriction endonuclease [Elusimicrobiota bacterium]